MKCVLSLLLLASSAWALSVTQPALGSAADEQRCAVTGTAEQFPAATRQVFFKFVAANVRAGDGLEVEWITPSGQVSSTIPFESLPAAPALCIVTQLPVGGFAPGSQPGAWRVQVRTGGQVIHTRSFRILADPAANGMVIRQVNHKALDGGGSELEMEGFGFDAQTIVNIAQYQKADGWRYVHFLFPLAVTESHLTVRVPKLAPGEYVVILKDTAGKLSAPARFLIETTGGYRLPVRPEESWRITQGPYGGFSHWGRNLHAYDLAPVRGACVVAMRGGVVTAHDGGYGQTPHLRIYGNYITVAHEDGEFSHYAHLRTGTFRVRTGQRVVQGQALAQVGNSGYSFGTHVHVHVTRQHWISTQSVPFRMEDAPAARHYRGPVQSRNFSPYGNCHSGSGTPPALISGGSAPPRPAPTWRGKIAVADWWHQTLQVARGAKNLVLELGWDGREREFELWLVSPSGRQYNPLYDATGFGALPDNGKRFALPNPEPGVWRLSVVGVRGGGELMDFWVARGS